MNRIYSFIIGMLFCSFAQGQQAFYLSPTFTKNMGIENLMPFGFKLSDQSEVGLYSEVDRWISKPIKIADASDYAPFEEVVYSFHDSILYKFQLLMPSGKEFQKKFPIIQKELDAYFGNKDFSNKQEVVYSDQEYLVRVDFKNGYMEVTSLDHQPLAAQWVQAINLRNYKKVSMFWYDLSDTESIGLEFYNQVAKENNVQMAFRIYYKGNKPLGFTKVNFELSKGTSVAFDVAPFIDLENGQVEKVSRCFIDAVEAKEILTAEHVKISLIGQEERSYEMPAYQKHSLKSALYFYKNNVTNPFIKYRGW